MPPTTSTSTTTSSTSTSTTTTLWFNPTDYEGYTGEAFVGTADAFYGLVNDIGEHLEDALGVAFSVRDISAEQSLGRYIIRGRSEFVFQPREYSPLSYTYLRVRTKLRPVNSVSAVVTKEKASSTSLDLTYLDIRDSIGVFYVLTTTGKPRESVTVETSYNVGYASPPSRVKRALALLVQEWLMAEERAVGGAEGWIVQYKIGDYSEKRALIEPGEVRIGLGTMLSKRAEMLLRPWLHKVRIG